MMDCQLCGSEMGTAGCLANCLDLPEKPFAQMSNDEIKLNTRLNLIEKRLDALEKGCKCK